MGDPPALLLRLLEEMAEDIRSTLETGQHGCVLRPSCFVFSNKWRKIFEALEKQGNMSDPPTLLLRLFK